MSPLNELGHELNVLRRAAQGRTDKLWPGFGLPFNGQMGRLAIVRTLIAAYGPDVFLETGTFLGHTTRFFQGGGAPVYTAELKLVFWLAARARLGWSRDLRLLRADSRSAIAELRAADHRRPFAYLDAHWWRDFPLISEVEQLLANWPEMLIVIDDCQIPDDDGYEYDAYDDEPLGLQLFELPDAVWAGYPAIHSSDETGARRGSLYLAQGERAVTACTLAGTQGLLRPAA